MHDGYWPSPAVKINTRIIIILCVGKHALEALDRISVMAGKEQQHVVVQLAALPPRPPADAGVAGDVMCPALYRAVRKGRIAAVRALLLRQQQHSAAASSSSDDQAAAGNMYCPPFFLKKTTFRSGRTTRPPHARCDVLELSAEGNTVLHVASEHGHGKLVRELCRWFGEDDTRANVLLARRNSAMDTPLHCAARAGNAEAVSSVLARLSSRDDCGEGSGVVLGYRNEAGDTALHLAARHGHDQAVEALVAAAPAVAAELNGAGVSPLYLAVMSGSVRAVRAITATATCGDSASAAGPSAQNALHAAVFQSKEMVELLLKWRPALADEVDCDGSTPLHFASSDGDLSVVRAILCDALPETVYRKDGTGGLSALHVAALMGHDRVVRELLRSCPDAAELRDNGGGTFLHAAAREQRCSVVTLAVKGRKLRGLLNTRDAEGNTPLHLAVAAGASEVVETVLMKGKVRADVLNNAGRTAFDLVAESTNYVTMVSLVVILVAFKAQPRPQRQDQVKPWNSTGLLRGIEKTSETLVVVAVLIATAAFAAGFNLPGGYDDKFGTSQLIGKFTFKIFLVFDTIAAGTSVAAAILLVYGKASRSITSCNSFVASLQFMWVSLMSLMLAFYAALVAAADDKEKKSRVYFIVTITIQLCIQVLSFKIMKWISPVIKSSRTNWRFLWQSRFSSKGRHVIKRKYPLAGGSIPNSLLFSVVTFVGFTGFGYLYGLL